MTCPRADPTDDRFRWPDVPVEIVEYHRRAMEWALSVVGNVTATQYDLPTPCPEWNVGELLTHMIQLSAFNLAWFTDGASTAGYGDAASGELSDAYASINAKLQRAIDAADVSRWHKAVPIPIGMLTAKAQLMLNLKNQIAHSWDLAVATGQVAMIPDDVATPIEAFAREVFAAAPSLRTGFGDPVTIPDGATAGERFVATVGRDPELAARVTS